LALAQRFAKNLQLTFWAVNRRTKYMNYVFHCFFY